MTVFLGDTGRVMLDRKEIEERFVTLVNPSDVRADVNRFSVDFAHEQLITGDSLEIRTTGGEDLTWIDDSTADDSFTRYAHIDRSGGIRLYNTFSEAIRGDLTGSIDLKAPTQNQEVTIRITGGGDNRCLAEVTSYQITTSRETIDSTHLGAQYRKKYEAGLIQGQGSLECLWHKPGYVCDSGFDGSQEFVSYLARLCLRLVHGAAFSGYLYLHRLQ